MTGAAAATHEIHGRRWQPWAPDGLTHWSVLMACAEESDHPVALALAGVIAQAWQRHGLDWLPLPGLDAQATRRLLLRWFPGAETDLALDWPLLAARARAEPRYDEIEEIVGLLTEHACPPHQAGTDDISGVAHAIGLASLGDNHLWQDMQLPNRAALTALMTHCFPSLTARNTHDMKWKRFIYRQLCDRAEVQACRAPSCGVCSDYHHCFGSEEAVLSGVA